MYKRFRDKVSFCFIIIFFLGMIGSAYAGLAPLIPREVLFGNPVKASPEVSPDGKSLAYLAPYNGVMNVWVKTIGKDDDRVVTADKKRGIRGFYWQQDSGHILYMQDFDGDENWHVYQTNLKTKITRDITPFQGVKAEIITIDPNFPDEILVALNINDPKLHDVYRVNLNNGAVLPDTKNPGDVLAWVADNNFQIRAALATLPDGGTEIRVRKDSKSPWRVLQKWGPDEVLGGVPGFTPDGKSVWVISSVNANAARLLQINLTDGKSKVIAQDNQYDVDGVLINPEKHNLEAVKFIKQRGEWILIDKNLKTDFDVVKNFKDGDFDIISRDLKDKTWITQYNMDNAPVSYYVYNRGAKQPQFLFTNRPALEKYTLSKMLPVSFHARDGMTIYGYLTLPAGVEPKNLPMVLLVHGGPWARDMWGLNSMAQFLANRGYAVLQINYRGSTGYGKMYLNAGDREWSGKMHSDLIDGKNWAVGQGYCDPKKTAIMGASYGGYATLVGLTFTPDEFTCGIDIVGPSNLITLLKTIPPYWATIKAVFEKRMGKSTEEDFLKSCSPLFKADQIKAPLLIGQGANDPRVKQSESDQIVQAMRAKNIPVTYIVYADEGHGFARPENKLDFYGRVEEFLAKNLGGRFEPWKEVPGSSALVK